MGPEKCKTGGMMGTHKERCPGHMWGRRYWLSGKNGG